MRAPRARDFTHFLHFVTGFLRSARKNTCFFRKNGYNLGDTNKCSILKKEREKAPSHVDAKRQRRSGGFRAPTPDKNQYLQGCGSPLPPWRKDTLSIASSDFLALLFLLSKVAQKKKKQKENAAKETRQRKLFEKSFLWNPSKTFTRHMPDFRCVHPTDSESPAARRFLKKGSFGILQKLLHGTCQTFAVCTQLTLKAPPQGGF